MSRSFPRTSHSTIKVIMQDRRTTRAAMVALLYGLASLTPLAMAPLAASPPLAAEELNRIILRVNDQIYTLYDFEKRKASEIASMLADPRMDPASRQERLSKIGQQILKQVFQDMLLESRSKQIGIYIDEAEVEAEVRNVQEQQGLSSPEEFEQALSQYGMSLEDYRANLRQQMSVQQVLGREVWSQIDVGEEELRAYYRNHLDDFRIPEQRSLKEVIVLESSGLGADELRSTAESIYRRLSTGEDLEAVIGTHREDGVSTGLIDLGWLEPDELEGSLAEAAWALKAGEYSAPVLARGGYHILFAAGIKESELKPFSDVETEILARERSLRYAKEARAYVLELERQAHIVENLPPDAVGYRNVADDFEEEAEFDFFGPASQIGAEEAADDQGS